MALFRDSIEKRDVSVDGKPVKVEEKVKASDLIRAAGKDSSTYSIVRTAPTGETEVIPNEARITVKDGEQLETDLTSIGG